MKQTRRTPSMNGDKVKRDSLLMLQALRARDDGLPRAQTASAPGRRSGARAGMFMLTAGQAQRMDACLLEARSSFLELSAVPIAP